MNAAPDALKIIDSERLAPEFDLALRALEADGVVRRIWARDWTVWKPEDREISSRLGWLAAPGEADRTAPEIESFAASVRGQGMTRAVVLGMGGSSLAPEVFARLFDAGPGALEVEVLDTTEPETVAAAGARLAPEKTLFLVSSKSGTTAEVLALVSYFYDRVRTALGAGHAGSRFVAVTDPGTPLEAMACKLGFRRVFLGPPDIGGRFSALTPFGLVPAALKGLDLGRLLAPALEMAAACRVDRAPENPGTLLGAALGAAALKGMDKLTILLPQRLRPFGGWLEQLVAESTGKEGRGIVPVVEDRPGPAASYGPDRLFVEIGGPDAAPGRAPVRAREGLAGPVIRLPFADPYGLAAHFFLWEFATAVAGRVLKINPFDQPDVESTKRRTREVLAAAVRPAPPATDGAAPAGKVRVAGPGEGGDPAAAWSRLVGGGAQGDYLAVLAFLPRRPAVEELLSGIAAGIRLKTGLPVTTGFGPRYLHSTGQLHKGDGNTGLFVILVPDRLPHVEIPGVPGVARPAEDFAALFLAQARGDALALSDKGRRVLTLELASPLEAALGELASLLR